MLGIGAIVGVYELLTSGSRKTAEESDKLTKSINDQAAATLALTVAGRQLTAQKAAEAAATAASPKGAGFFSLLLQGMAPGGQSMHALSTGDAQKVTDTAKAAQNALNDLGKTIGETNTKIEADRKRLADEADAALQKRIDILTKGIIFDNTRAKVTSELVGLEHQFTVQVNDGNASLEKRITAATRLGQVMDALERKFTRPSTTGNTALASLIGITGNGETAVSRALTAYGQPMPSVTMKGTSSVGGITRQEGQADLIGAQQEIHVKELTAAEKNAKETQQVIWGAAMQSANAIVNALNIGGGGKNSQLGGTLGGTAGFAIGYAYGGPIGGAIGSTVGNVAGSFIGGLFDHKKSVDRNTQAINGLTAALFNTPQGYKLSSARYRADEGRSIYDASAAEAYRRRLRGGVGNLGMAT